MSLNVRGLVKTCSWIDVTPQLRRTGRRENKTATELELGTYALLRSSATRATDPGQDPLSPIAL